MLQFAITLCWANADFYARSFLTYQFKMFKNSNERVLNIWSFNMFDFVKSQQTSYENEGDNYYFDCFVDLFFLQGATYTVHELVFQILLAVLLLETYSNTA